jgi:hypothetical protein
MSDHSEQGGASASPIVSAFLAQGGRLLINPNGELEVAAGSLAWASADDPRRARRGFTVCRRFYRRLRNPRFAGSVKALVIRDGEPTPNGWLVVRSGP